MGVSWETKVGSRESKEDLDKGHGMEWKKERKGLFSVFEDLIK